jgi:hypothetical protein
MTMTMMMMNKKMMIKKYGKKNINCNFIHQDKILILTADIHFHFTVTTVLFIPKGHIKYSFIAFQNYLVHIRPATFNMVKWMRFIRQMILNVTYQHQKLIHLVLLLLNRRAIISEISFLNSTLR